jgi:adenylate cyclase
MTRVKLTAFRVGLLSTLVVVLLYAFTAPSTLLRNLEANTLDLRFHLRGRINPTPHVVLIVIDDRSIAELGRWPWNRKRFADMLDRLRQAGAKVVAFDLLFSEPEVVVERDALTQLRQAIAALDTPDRMLSDSQRELVERMLVQLDQAVDPDAALATAVRQAGTVVLGFAAPISPSLPQPSPAQPHPSPLISRSAYRVLQHLGAERSLLSLGDSAVMVPIAPIAQEAVALGHVNIALDADGTPRYEYPVAMYAGDYYPSLAIQVTREFLGLSLDEVRVQFGEGIQLGQIFIPTDEAMRLLVNYVGPRGAFPTYAFADVLQGRLPDAVFRDNIVLIGGGASGLGDVFVTPFSAALPGVERHATVIDNILRQDFLHRRDSTALIDIACIAVLGLLIAWLSPKFPSFWGSLVALALGGLYTVANVLAFTQAGLWVNLLFPLLTVALTQSSLTLFRFLTEERQKHMIRRAFQFYLHPAVVDQVSQHPQLLKLGGEARELTVLFADIRGFSTIAEGLTPETLVHRLNEYFSVMTRVVFAHNGLLDKYIGDAIMAVYGVPLHTPDHAYQACCTALDMMRELSSLQATWHERGLPSMTIGIGINTATMVVGNMGSDLRFDYTVIGDGVNLASRLEGANKEYGAAIIISESTWDQVKDRLVTRELDIIRVQGKAQQTRIFEVLGRPPQSPSQTTLIRLFEEGLQAYRARQWAEASQLFQQALTLHPGDRPSQLYLLRCKTLMAAPPSDQWDGIHNLETK